MYVAPPHLGGGLHNSQQPHRILLQAGRFTGGSAESTAPSVNPPSIAAQAPSVPHPADYGPQNLYLPRSQHPAANVGNKREPAATVAPAVARQRASRARFGQRTPRASRLSRVEEMESRPASRSHV